MESWHGISGMEWNSWKLVESVFSYSSFPLNWTTWTTLMMNCFEMSVHVSWLREWSSTNRTDVWFFSSMSSLMFRESRVVSKGIRTHVALKGSLSRMNPHVSRQGWPLNEVLVTFSTLISSTCFGGMSSKMCSISNSRHEDFATLLTLDSCWR